MPRSRWSAFFSLLLVFLSGVVVGGFAYRLYTSESVNGPGRNGGREGRRPDPEEIRKHQVAEMRTKLKLDDQQVSQLEKIYDETREQFGQMSHKMETEGSAIWDNQNLKIKNMLRPEQAVLFDQWRTARDLQRKQHRKMQPPPSK